MSTKKIQILGSFTSSAPAVRVADIELLSANWVGQESPYSQVVNIPGVTEYSQVDLKPTISQLNIFYNKDLVYFRFGSWSHCRILCCISL